MTTTTPCRNSDGSHQSFVQDHANVVYDKLRRNFEEWKRSSSSSKKTIPVVLVSTGSYNPIHVQHLQLFELARQQLEAADDDDDDNGGRYHCVAGFLSPSHDTYVSGKFSDDNDEFIEGRHRLEMIRLATQDSTWLSGHDWELRQRWFVDFGPTVEAIRQEIIEAVLGIIPTNNNNTAVIQVKYLCGMDHALKCGLLMRQNSHNYYWSNSHPTLGLVVVSRPATTDDDTDRVSLSAEKEIQDCHDNGIWIVNDETNNESSSSSSPSSSSHASSTAIREAICEFSHQQHQRPIPHLEERVEQYLRRHGKEIGGIYARLQDEEQK